MELNFEYLREHALERAESGPPVLPLSHLDTLWLQVTGTLCNLACLHCFISCGPKNHNHEYMTLGQVRDAIETGAKNGVRAYYFTGGEPFLHPEIREMIALALEHGPLTVLTNGILIDVEMAAWLAETFRASRYSFDLRVSLDGTTPAENDALRGRGTFEKILAAIERLEAAGLNPVITVTTCHAADAGGGLDGDQLVGERARRAFYDFVRSRGIEQPRMKFLAPFKIGREERRGGGYEDWERLVDGDLLPGEAEELQCSSCRMVTAKGVYPCPILVEHDDARMGDELEDALVDIELRHQACYTCHVQGVSCAT
jgi:MoaA/NifB/PqqE/SkfB family radical SAM enzyme